MNCEKITQKLNDFQGRIIEFDPVWRKDPGRGFDIMQSIESKIDELYYGDDPLPLNISRLKEIGESKLLLPAAFDRLQVVGGKLYYSTNIGPIYEYDLNDFSFEKRREIVDVHEEFGKIYCSVGVLSDGSFILDEWAGGLQTFIADKWGTPSLVMGSTGLKGERPLEKFVLDDHLFLPTTRQLLIINLLDGGHGDPDPIRLPAPEKTDSNYIVTKDKIIVAKVGTDPMNVENVPYLLIYDRVSGIEEKKAFDGYPPISSIAKLNDDEILIGIQHFTKIYNLKTKKVTQAGDYFPDVTAVLPLGGDLIAAGHDNGEIMIHDLPGKYTGKSKYKSLKGHKSPVRRIFKMGRKIVSVSEDGVMKLWG